VRTESINRRRPGQNYYEKDCNLDCCKSIEVTKFQTWIIGHKCTVAFYSVYLNYTKIMFVV
jgi:hypothetical protein